MTHDVFLSYSSKDKSIADGVVSTLEQNGIRCWYAPRDIKPSEDWGQAIANAIQDTRVFLIIFSEHANQSQHVLDELLFAIDQGNIILPFRIENLEPEGAMRLHLSSRHWLDAYDPSWQTHLASLVKNTSTILETDLPDKQIELPRKYARKKKRAFWKVPLIAAVVILVVAGIGIALRGGSAALGILTKSAPQTTSTTQPPEETTRVSEVDGMVELYVPRGSFMMGSGLGVMNERPVHMVELAGFWIDQHEVTNAQFAAFLDDQGNQEEAGAAWFDTSRDNNPIEFSAGSWVPQDVYSDHPVVNVTWYGAQAYCEWAGRRLPTEAEWEMAARGGLDEKKFPWGDEQPICEKDAQNGARFDDDRDCNNRGTTSVMTYAPNGYGLYDMAGNVWEWVNDRYWGYYYYISPENNPPGPAIGLSRVLRGGGWFTDAYHARVSYRNYDRPSYSYNVVGFRCADSLQ